ncbi:MAG: undecaprenyl/decaprenyl-phosphate alpha-N-acetylglucosaminyl 1-phosphate transferase [Planctomycetota bacterium]|nr:MAG: undecaprenyl/decaprenyl-phosphate alpha-N-acetylglucosaminyl 1-phosphate transferase [Planctomycetota bacterium]
MFDEPTPLLDLTGLAPPTDLAPADALPVEPMSAMGVFNGYLGVLVVAFLVTLLVTPILRRLALAYGVIDRPDFARKAHRLPVAYLGGVAVFLGVLAAIGFALLAPAPMVEAHPSVVSQRPVPVSILFGMLLITGVGLYDDLVGLNPRIKIAGQLLAAAVLAMEDVGVKVAAGVLAPIASAVGVDSMILSFNLPIVGAEIRVDLVYWTGTAIIALFILGACNASNLLDGLDGLLTGVTAIALAAMLVIALGLAVASDGPLDGARLIVCLAALGACLGFLPHNFKPATIFLGDCGSMLLGYLAVVVILTLGDTGRTPLVVAGLIAYAVPIIDTTLAIVRRRMAGRSMSEPDHEHIHHLLKRAVGVVPAVLILYGLGAVFGVIAVTVTLGRARIAYAFALIFAAFIGVTAVKIARQKIFEEQARALAEGRPFAQRRRAPRPEPTPDPAPAEPSRA